MPNYNSLIYNYFYFFLQNRTVRKRTVSFKSDTQRLSKNRIDLNAQKERTKLLMKGFKQKYFSNFNL